MNVYKVTVDSVDEIHLATNMQLAIESSFESFEIENAGHDYCNRDYFEDLVEQCVLLGELTRIANPAMTDIVLEVNT